MPAPSTQRAIVSRSSSVKPKRRRTGSDGRAGRGPRLASARPPARSSSWPTTPSSGLVWVSDRSASRTRSWWPGWAAVVGDDLASPKRGRDQRRVGLDVGAHHQDVARLEGGGRRRAGPRAPRAAPRPGGLGRGRRAPGCCGRRRSARARRAGSEVALRGDVGLQPAEQGVPRGCVEPGPGGRRRRPPREVRCSSRRSRPERREQRVPDLLVGAVVASRDRPGRAGERVPQGARRVRQPEVHVAVRAQRVEQLDLGHGDPGVPEEGEPRREVERLGPPRSRSTTAACRTTGDGAGDDLGDQPAPQLGLPGQVGVDQRSPAPSVSRPASQSASRLGTLDGVRREQPRQPTGDGVAAAPPQVALLAGLPVTEVLAQHPAPGLAGTWRRRPSSSGQTSASGAHGSCSRGAGRTSATRIAGTGTRPRRRRRRRDPPPARAGGRAAGSASARRRAPGTSTQLLRERVVQRVAQQRRPARRRAGPPAGRGGRSGSPHVPPRDSRSARSPGQPNPALRQRGRLIRRRAARVRAQVGECGPRSRAGRDAPTNGPSGAAPTSSSLPSSFIVAGTSSDPDDRSRRRAGRPACRSPIIFMNTMPLVENAADHHGEQQRGAGDDPPGPLYAGRHARACCRGSGPTAPGPGRAGTPRSPSTARPGSPA